MRKKVFFFRIFAGFFILLSVEAGIIYFVFESYHQKVLLQVSTRYLLNIAKILEYNITKFSRAQDTLLLEEVVKKWGRKNHIFITLIDSSGKVIADSREGLYKMENYKYLPEVLSAENKGMGVAIRHSPYKNSRMLYLAYLFKNGDGRKIIRIGAPIIENKPVERIVLIVFFLLILSLLISYLLEKSIQSPIKELTLFTARLANGQFGETLIPQRNDEIGELIRSLNNVSLRLKELFGKMKNQQVALKGILDAVPEAIALIGKDGKVLYANKVFEEVFKKSPAGRFYWEIPVLSMISDIIESHFEQRNAKESRIFYEDRYYHVLLKPAGEESSIVLLRNITESKKLEETKRQLVSNISHELRTPLTAVKGYLEALEEMMHQRQAHEYIKIIKKHTDRLINLTRDLLLLDEVENTGLPTREPVSLKKCIENVVKIYKPQFLKKGLELRTEILNDAVIIGDEIKIEQMLINLIDNALKYTEKGFVRITLKKKDNLAVIKIEDTGVGISEEHLSRIFERFYVVDRARSREKGGTGLGLSIVKHIVKLHGGIIEVKSQPGKGTVFTITFPVYENEQIKHQRDEE